MRTNQRDFEDRSPAMTASIITTRFSTAKIRIYIPIASSKGTGEQCGSEISWFAGGHNDIMM
jgi:hypothetical protein